MVLALGSNGANITKQTLSTSFTNSRDLVTCTLVTVFSNAPETSTTVIGDLGGAWRAALLGWDNALLGTIALASLASNGLANRTPDLATNNTEFAISLEFAEPTNSTPVISTTGDGCWEGYSIVSVGKAGESEYEYGGKSVDLHDLEIK